MPSICSRAAANMSLASDIIFSLINLEGENKTMKEKSNFENLKVMF